jgi:hypothetical protein
MNKLLTGLATVPLMSSVAFAGQLLTDRQMDAVTAGTFTAFSTSNAQSYGAVTTAKTTNVAEVAPLTTASGAPVTVSVNGMVLNINKPVSAGSWLSVSAGSSLSTAANLP